LFFADWNEQDASKRLIGLSPRFQTLPNAQRQMPDAKTHSLRGCSYLGMYAFEGGARGGLTFLYEES
jgi:hypothetical protein